MESRCDSRPGGRCALGARSNGAESCLAAFEKRFTVTRPVREATLHITGLGFYEASLNGQRIGRKVLDPAPTRYDRRVLYSTYDMTEMLARGENRLHVLLGHGWYDVRSVAVWNFDNAPWRDFPRMLAQLEITYDDGTRTMVVSDDTWRQVASPIGFDCIREGEVIGKAPKGAPNLEKQVVRADVVPAPADISRLRAAAERSDATPEASRCAHVTPGTWLVDFSQNTSSGSNSNSPDSAR